MWTYDLPNEPGYYWVKYTNRFGEHNEIIEVIEGMDSNLYFYEHGIDMSPRVDTLAKKTYKWQFFGPIEPPR